VAVASGIHLFFPPARLQAVSEGERQLKQTSLHSSRGGSVLLEAALVMPSPAAWDSLDLWPSSIPAPDLVPFASAKAPEPIPLPTMRRRMFIPDVLPRLSVRAGTVSPACLLGLDPNGLDASAPKTVAWNQP